MDRGYDNDHLQDGCMLRGVSPVVALKDTAGVKKGAAKAPCCEHGEWSFAGADYNRRATPGGSRTATASGAIEREFGRLKHEWALLPRRVRGVERVQLHADLSILANSRLESVLSEE